MTYLVESSVPLTEVADVLQTTPEAVELEAVQLFGSVGVDWRGRPAVSTREASQLVTGAGRRAADNSRANWEYQLAVESWEAERELVRTAAFTEAYDQAIRRGRGEGRQQRKPTRQRVKQRSKRRRPLRKSARQPRHVG